MKRANSRRGHGPALRKLLLKHKPCLLFPFLVLCVEIKKKQVWSLRGCSTVPCCGERSGCASHEHPSSEGAEARQQPALGTAVCCTSWKNHRQRLCEASELKTLPGTGGERLQPPHQRGRAKLRGHDIPPGTRMSGCIFYAAEVMT